MNLVRVSQGHKDSISLEVFLKSYLLLNKTQREKIVLYTFKPTLEKNLKALGIKNINLNTIFLEADGVHSESVLSLHEAIEDIKQGDCLYTLPTTKTDLSFKGVDHSGHTDFLRKRFNSPYLVMLFKSEHIHMALLTEHISLSQVEAKINNKLIKNKVSNIIKSRFNFKNLIFTGINPHCGEQGLISSTDNIISENIKALKKEFPAYNFSGRISGDTALCNPASLTRETCLIAASHDQGLAPFKALTGFRAANITLGLPFLRLSPDHGTAFDLYGKNKANYLGGFYTLKEALSAIKS